MERTHIQESHTPTSEKLHRPPSAPPPPSSTSSNVHSILSLFNLFLHDMYDNQLRQNFSSLPSPHCSCTKLVWHIMHNMLNCLSQIQKMTPCNVHIEPPHLWFCSSFSHYCDDISYIFHLDRGHMHFHLLSISHPPMHYDELDLLD